MRDSYYKKNKIVFYKNKKFFTILVGLFLIMLMALGAVNVGMNDDDSTIEYNGLEFSQTNDGWRAYLDDDSAIYLVFNPEELVIEEEFSISFSTLSNSEKVYFSYDPSQESQYAMYDLSRNFVFQKIVYSCYEDSDLCTDMPLKTCDDATNNVGVVVFKVADENSVSLEDNCLSIEGKSLLNVVDKLVLDYYG